MPKNHKMWLCNMCKMQQYYKNFKTMLDGDDFTQLSQITAPVIYMYLMGNISFCEVFVYAL